MPEPNEDDFPGLVKRFTPEQAERAAQISNDIAEDIDNGETRKELRMAVAYWHDRMCVEAQARATAESALEIYRSAKKLMDMALEKPQSM
jgi:hypothetical protein